MLRDFAKYWYECCRLGKPSRKKVYGQLTCHVCGALINLVRTGDRNRITYFCPKCQSKQASSCTSIPSRQANLVNWCLDSKSNPTEAPGPTDEWPCSRCTFINKTVNLKCEMCTTTREPARSLDSHEKATEGNAAAEAGFGVDVPVDKIREICQDSDTQETRSLLQLTSDQKLRINSNRAAALQKKRARMAMQIDTDKRTLQIDKNQECPSRLLGPGCVDGALKKTKTTIPVSANNPHAGCSSSVPALHCPLKQPKCSFCQNPASLQRVCSCLCLYLHQPSFHPIFLQAAKLIKTRFSMM